MPRRGEHLFAHVGAAESGHRAGRCQDRPILRTRAENDAEAGLVGGVDPATSDVDVAAPQLAQQESTPRVLADDADERRAAGRAWRPHRRRLPPRTSRRSRRRDRQAARPARIRAPRSRRRARSRRDSARRPRGRRRRRSSCPHPVAQRRQLDLVAQGEDALAADLAPGAGGRACRWRRRRRGRPPAAARRPSARPATRPPSRASPQPTALTGRGGAGARSRRQLAVRRRGRCRRRRARARRRRRRARAGRRSALFEAPSSPGSPARSEPSRRRASARLGATRSGPAASAGSQRLRRSSSRGS